jgi:hypothetical protein
MKDLPAEIQGKVIDVSLKSMAEALAGRRR